MDMSTAFPCGSYQSPNPGAELQWLTIADTPPRKFHTGHPRMHALLCSQLLLGPAEVIAKSTALDDDCVPAPAT
jgi:hypothetical protein